MDGATYGFIMILQNFLFFNLHFAILLFFKALNVKGGGKKYATFNVKKLGESYQALF